MCDTKTAATFISSLFHGHTYTAAMQKKGVVKVTIRMYVASYGKTDLL